MKFDDYVVHFPALSVSGMSSDNSHEQLMQQNQLMTENLAKKVSRLRDVSVTLCRGVCYITYSCAEYEYALTECVNGILPNHLLLHRLDCKTEC